MPTGTIGQPVRIDKRAAPVCPCEGSRSEIECPPGKSQKVAAFENPGGRIERPLACVAAAAVDRDHAERRKKLAGLPVVEILGLADKADRRGAAAGKKKLSITEV